jgi:hypothetical protein
MYEEMDYWGQLKFVSLPLFLDYVFVSMLCSLLLPSFCHSLEQNLGFRQFPFWTKIFFLLSFGPESARFGSILSFSLLTFFGSPFIYLQQVR